MTDQSLVRRLTTGLKRGVMQASRGLGISRFISATPWRQRRLAILGLHGISIDDEHQWDPHLFHSPEALEHRFEALRRNGCTVVSLDEGLDGLRTGSLPPRAVVLTFDDGNVDFMLRAWPLLRSFDYPATLYVSTYYCGRPWPVFNAYLRYLLWKGRRPAAVLGEASGSDRAWPLEHAVDREAAATAIRERADAGRLSGSERDAMLVELERALDVDGQAIRARRILHLLSGPELRTLADEGLSVQLHTHRHRFPAGADEAEREICDNLTSLESMTGRRPVHLAYPSGLYRVEHIPLLESLGVRSGTTCESGLVEPGAHPLLLPRIMDMQTVPDEEFEGWITGVRAAFPAAACYQRIPHLPLSAP